MHVYDLDDGTRLVKAARNSIELFISNPHFQKDVVKKSVEDLDRSHGIFVTLLHYPTRELRGCIGFPRPVGAIGELVVDAAVAAAFEDSRFVSVSRHELDDLIVEVAVLSDMTKVSGGESKRLSEIKIGRDGLMIEYGLRMGLLLPSMAVENVWNKKRFMEEACEKAELPRNYWMQPNVKLYRFESQLFVEETPKGNVVEAKYGETGEKQMDKPKARKRRAKAPRRRK